MKTIKMIETAANSAGVYTAKTIQNVEDDLADLLIAASAAIEVLEDTAQEIADEIKHEVAEIPKEFETAEKKIKSKRNK